VRSLATQYTHVFSHRSAKQAANQPQQSVIHEDGRIDAVEGGMSSNDINFEDMGEQLHRFLGLFCGRVI